MIEYCERINFLKDPFPEQSDYMIMTVSKSEVAKRATNTIKDHGKKVFQKCFKISFNTILIQELLQTSGSFCTVDVT